MDIVIQSIQTQLRNRAAAPGLIEVIRTALFRNHLKIDWIIRTVTFLLPAIFLSVVVFQPWVEARWMFLDPLTAAELSGDCCHSHYGFVSTAGIILWAATAAVSLFAAALLIIGRAGFDIILFPLLAGLFTGWLALDDAFLLHETVLPAFGIPQNLVIAFYGLLALTYFFLNLKSILENDFWLLAMGGAALSLSVVVDVAFHSLNPSLVLLEDSAKFFGIFCWASFHITTFLKIIVNRLSPSEAL